MPTLFDAVKGKIPGATGALNHSYSYQKINIAKATTLTNYIHMFFTTMVTHKLLAY
jgi:hypothetical protein